MTLAQQHLRAAADRLMATVGRFAKTVDEWADEQKRYEAAKANMRQIFTDSNDIRMKKKEGKDE